MTVVINSPRMNRFGLRPGFAPRLPGWAAALLLLACACSDPEAESKSSEAAEPTRSESTRTDRDDGDESAEDEDEDEAEDADAEGNGDEVVEGGSKERDDSAILVAAFVRTPDGRNIYVGATKDVPKGKVDYSQWLEFGNVDVYTANGFVYVWERDPATMTQFTVTKDLALEKGPTLSFLNYGLGGGGLPVFITKNRAYVLSAALDIIVVYDPTEMEITETIDVTVPERPGLEPYALDGVVFGDSVVWLLDAQNLEAQKTHLGVTALVASASSNEPPRIVEDDRCVGSDGLHLDDKGDLYVRAGAYWGVFAAYGEAADSVRTCMLRMRSGETEFDPDFLVDFEEVTGTYVNGPWFYVGGSQFIAHVWNPEVEVPEAIDDYWSFEGYQPFLVDIEARTAEPYPDLEGGVVVSSSEFKVDDVRYYQLSETGTAVNARTRIVELHPDGIREAFSLQELWALARIR